MSSMAGQLTVLLGQHQLIIRHPAGRGPRWACSCGKRTYTGGTRSAVVDVHEQHQGEALAAAGVTPPRADPREAFLDRIRGGGQPIN